MVSLDVPGDITAVSSMAGSAARTDVLRRTAAAFGVPAFAGDIVAISLSTVLGGLEERRPWSVSRRQPGRQLEPTGDGQQAQSYEWEEPPQSPAQVAERVCECLRGLGHLRGGRRALTGTR